MNKSNIIFRIQLAQFKREKGMIVFYCLVIIVSGIIIPFFLHRGESASIITPLVLANTFATMFLKPILSDSLAGEREQKTLETLISTPMNGKTIIWGKFKFCMLFSVCFFGITVLCAVLTSLLTGYESTLFTWQWFGIVLLAAANFCAISITGIHASAVSGDLRTANNRVSRIAYPLGLLFIAYLSIIVSVDFLSAIIISFALLIIYLCLVFTYAIKAVKMKQSDYFENIKIKKSKKMHEKQASYVAPKSQFGIVLGFEFKYLMTWKLLLLNFVLLCFAPAIFVYLLPYYTGRFDLNYAVLITALMIPRVPTNLIASSIGGEKAYKTGESLLSTPLHVRPVFLAKCMVPIIVTVVMLIISSIITLISVYIAALIMPDAPQIYGYSAEQLVLLFPVSIMSSITMMFIAAILTVIMKTPRQGLYANSVISFFFVAPVLAIVYLTHNTLMWSVKYLIILVLCNAVCIKSIFDKITRPQIMSKL